LTKGCLGILLPGPGRRAGGPALHRVPNNVDIEAGAILHGRDAACPIYSTQCAWPAMPWRYCCLTLESPCAPARSTGAEAQFPPLQGWWALWMLMARTAGIVGTGNRSGESWRRILARFRHGGCRSLRPLPPMRPWRFAEGGIHLCGSDHPVSLVDVMLPACFPWDAGEKPITSSAVKPSTANEAGCDPGEFSRGGLIDTCGPDRGLEIRNALGGVALDVL